MKKLIIDSSVIVKWLNQTNEERLQEADNVIKDVKEEKVTIETSELAKYEVGNVFLLRKKISISEAKISLSSLYTLPLKFHTQTENLATETFKIAKEANITFYDASFMALAKQENATLVTDNPKHQAAIKEVKVIALKDYK